MIGAALAAPMLARHGWAQSTDWPKGPVRWVVAYAAGGAADTVARNIAARVAEIIGQRTWAAASSSGKVVNANEPCFGGLPAR